jgi:hypothetical protein
MAATNHIIDVSDALHHNVHILYNVHLLLFKHVYEQFYALTFFPALHLEEP